MRCGNFLQKAETFCGQYGLTLAQAVGILSIIIGVLCFLRRFSLRRVRLFSPHKLKILESKSLGNRQFLLVIAYESEKFLIGVYPNGMRFLCKLDTDKENLTTMESLQPNVPSL